MNQYICIAAENGQDMGSLSGVPLFQMIALEIFGYSFWLIAWNPSSQVKLQQSLKMAQPDQVGQLLSQWAQNCSVTVRFQQFPIDAKKVWGKKSIKEAF